MSRDMSAFTTLDNANMGTREDFEKMMAAYESKHLTGSSDLVRKIAAYFYEARQQETDALNHRFEEANKLTVEWMEKCKELKAENERLRKDAERYQWLRDPKTDIALVIDKVVDEIPSEEGTGYDGLKVYEYRAGEELDAAIDAAMSALPDTKGE